MFGFYYLIQVFRLFRDVLQMDIHCVSEKTGLFLFLFTKIQPLIGSSDYRCGILLIGILLLHNDESEKNTCSLYIFCLLKCVLYTRLVIKTSMCFSVIFMLGVYVHTCMHIMHVVCVFVTVCVCV